MERAVIILLLACSSSFAQICVDKFVIGKGETFRITGSDIVVADTLIMMDSARIVLNKLRPENYIRARVAIVASHCMIDGRGTRGVSGRNGRPGMTPDGPCQDGTNGGRGSAGLEGTCGINLFLYIDSMTVVGTLTIDLSGGNGGDGGRGGPGGGGSPGTRHCSGGNGGNGGAGGAGGSGGPGGTLTLGGDNVDGLRAMLRSEIIVLNKGGSFGYGGFAGQGGPAGLAPSGRNGKTGLAGRDGDHGYPGHNGTIFFESK